METFGSDLNPTTQLVCNKLVSCLLNQSLWCNTLYSLAHLTACNLSIDSFKVVIVIKLSLCRIHSLLPLLFSSNISILVSTNYRLLVLGSLDIIFRLLDSCINKRLYLVSLKSTIVQVLHSPLNGYKMIRSSLCLTALLCRYRCRSLLLFRQLFNRCTYRHLIGYRLFDSGRLRRHIVTSYNLFALYGIYLNRLLSCSISHDGLEFFCRHFRRLAVNKSINHIAASVYKHYSVVAFRVTIHKGIKLLIIAIINLRTLRSLLRLDILNSYLLADITRLDSLFLAVRHKGHQTLALVDINVTLIVKHHLTTGDENILARAWQSCHIHIAILVHHSINALVSLSNLRLTGGIHLVTHTHEFSFLLKVCINSILCLTLKFLTGNHRIHICIFAKVQRSSHTGLCIIDSFRRKSDCISIYRISVGFIITLSSHRKNLGISIVFIAETLFFHDVALLYRKDLVIAHRHVFTVLALADKFYNRNIIFLVLD